MTQTHNWFFDELGKFMTDAAGVANGMQQEMETFFKVQADKFLSNMDLVKREEFDAVKLMAIKAREDSEILSAKVAALEDALQKLQVKK